MTALVSLLFIAMIPIDVHVTCSTLLIRIKFLLICTICYSYSIPMMFVSDL